ncbi:hypothetical protein P170DRAFT_463021 [Aspergillus steynii IBT 23096]|uniref:Fungal-type protein kinase domain-containing protein n=1 Tax=Aspergillus steynii IBT 23096 TaxID=1392250 RepID=A0A2I2GK51_9EURO|nr:uncharacterized protein P170DRAFT_463021 [Aspergillus steynii IBT 23096]PLB53266.1 hypothetical protein P170DRAFT_463021 [Aspergillus steynii IBT 23096]
MSRAQPEHSTLQPIGEKLKAFREGFSSTCNNLGLESTLESLNRFDNEDLQNVCFDLVSALRSIPDLRTLPSPNRHKSFLSDILRLNTVISSDDFDIGILVPLLRAVLNTEPDNIIRDRIYSTVTASTPSPKPIPFLNQTPRCKEGDNPLYSDNIGWRDWPKSAQEKEVLQWLTGKVDMLREHLTRDLLICGSTQDRNILARPSQPLEGSVASRKLDVAIVSSSQNQPLQRAHWSHVLIPGELKSNGDLDTVSKTWRDLGRYVREVFTAQETRRYVLAFTLCGTTMRAWEFDRVGATASKPFDINRDGLRFLTVFAGYLLMNRTQLGYDPSIKLGPDGTHYIEITRNGKPERLVLNELMKRSPCVAGRATTCWKAHREGDESTMPLVVKDSWQYPERDEEGVLLQEALENGVTNIARHYFHETVEVGGHVDDTSASIRRDLDLSSARYHRSARSGTAANNEEDPALRGRTHFTTVGRKRPSSHMAFETGLPPPKRNCSSSPSKSQGFSALQNRVHRRVVVQDYGKPLYKASCHPVMLAALRCCLEGYQSLYMRTGLLQGDISTGNLLMGEEKDASIYPGFLIDLDLAIREKRDQPSGAWGKTGTRAFMPIGQLLGDAPSFVQGLESFFWVLFWICIHYNGPGDRGRVVEEFDEWNYVSMEELAKLKLGTVSDDGIFQSTMDKFTDYYKPLKHWVDELRRAIFPNGKIRRKEDKGLFEYSKYCRMHKRP